MAEIFQRPTSQNSSSRILVTGSAGFIGSHLLKKLADRQLDCTALYRLHLPEPMSKVTPVFADLMKKESLAIALHKTDSVVHLAWNPRFKAIENSFTDREESHLGKYRNLDMLANLLESMEKLHTRRIILLSVLGTSRYSESQYLREKYQAELMVLNSRIPQKIIVRSSIAYADLAIKDRFISAIEKLMKYPWFYPVPRHKKKISPIHVGDLCSAIASIAQLIIPQKESAQIVELSGDQELSLDEVFRIVSLGIGKGTQIPITGFLGEALTPLFEKMGKDSRKSGPHLRELLTLCQPISQDGSIASSYQECLPKVSRKFQEAMVKRDTYKNLL